MEAVWAALAPRVIVHRWVSVSHGLDSSRMRNWDQVSQLKLFDSCEGMLADDERGRIMYIPSFVDAETAQAWFTELHRGVRWRSERRDMYDREADVPRLLGSFRLDPAPEGDADGNSGRGQARRRPSRRAVQQRRAQLVP